MTDKPRNLKNSGLSLTKTSGMETPLPDELAVKTVSLAAADVECPVSPIAEAENENVLVRVKSTTFSWTPSLRSRGDSSASVEGKSPS